MDRTGLLYKRREMDGGWDGMDRMKVRFETYSRTAMGVGHGAFRSQNYLPGLPTIFASKTGSRNGAWPLEQLTAPRIMTLRRSQSVPRTAGDWDSPLPR